MSSSVFPTALDTYNNPGPNNSTDDAGFYLDVEITKLNDSVQAVENQVGVTDSIIISSHDYIIRNHKHLGNDNSSKFPMLTAQAVSDGPVLSLLSASGTPIAAASTANVTGTTFAITAAGLTSTALSVGSASGGTPTADLMQYNGPEGVLGGVNASGGNYSSGSSSFIKSPGGLAYMSTQPTKGEIDYPNGSMHKGYSGAVGTGQQYQLDNSQGLLELGGPTGLPALVLNAWRTNRTTQIALYGKDNADSGGVNFNILADADGQLAPQARSLMINGQLANKTTGVDISADPFLGLSYPTYDGVSTYTKSAGVSVLPGVNPPQAAGTFSVAGAASISTALQVGSTLTVAGPLNANGGISAGSQRVQNVAAPLTGTDAVNQATMSSSFTSSFATAFPPAFTAAYNGVNPVVGPLPLTGVTGSAPYGAPFANYALLQDNIVVFNAYFVASANIAANGAVAQLPAAIPTPTNVVVFSGITGPPYAVTVIGISSNGQITTTSALTKGIGVAISGSYLVGG